MRPPMRRSKVQATTPASASQRGLRVRQSRVTQRGLRLTASRRQHQPTNLAGLVTDLLPQRRLPNPGVAVLLFTGSV